VHDVGDLAGQGGDGPADPLGLDADVHDVAGRDDRRSVAAEHVGAGRLLARQPKALEVKTDEWQAEVPQIQEWFAKFGDTLPAMLWTELDGLKARLGKQ
jgi:hypothetical protein